MLGWPRVRFTLLFTVALGLLLGTDRYWGLVPMLIRTMLVGFGAMLVFGVFEHWPRQLPRWCARWVLQVVAVAVTIPFLSAIAFAITNPAGRPPFYHVKQTMQAYSTLTVLAVFLAPWTALGALVRQKEALARHQALSFALERSEFERQALDARLRMLQGQVAPHFMFNTLANVQALVDAGSPQASTVLRSLVAYLRAAVPRLDEATTTVAEELQLVQAYLELMHMRMPDRLQFAVHADPAALPLRCPPMTLLTLVENAVRHGVDPSEDGGRIDIDVQRHGDRCLIRVRDSGVGFRVNGDGLGTGLSSLRSRLQLTFGDAIALRVGAQHPRGVSAEVEFPAREGGA